MAHKWYSVTIQYQKMDEAGSLKNRTENYLFDCLSFTETEAKAVEELTPYVGSDFEIVNIDPVRLVDVYIHETGDYWWKTKNMLELYDEKSDRTKERAEYCLVNAATLDEALERITKEYNKYLVPWTFSAIYKTGYTEVFKYGNHVSPQTEISFEKPEEVIPVVVEFGEQVAKTIEKKVKGKAKNQPDWTQADRVF